MDEIQRKLLLFVVSGGAHEMPPVTEQPRVRLVRWTIAKIWHPGFAKCRSPYHVLTGHDGVEGRLTSPLVAYDWDRMEMTTHSGRVYQLVGPSEPDSDGIWLLNRGLHGDIRAKDATPAVERILRMRGKVE